MTPPAPMVKVKLRKLRSHCWPRRHQWLPAYDERDVLRGYMCKRCSQVKRVGNDAA